jgi:hypothetical protein
LAKAFFEAYKNSELEDARMCQNMLKNLLDAVYETVNDKPTGERTLEKLKNGLGYLTNP